MTNFLKDIAETANFLGIETIDCLKCLFAETNGEPPYVNKKRYRVNHVDQMKTLDHLEHSLNLIKTEHIDSQDYYRVRPYAIPLINSKKSKDLLDNMSEFFEILKNLYKDRLDEIITTEELLKISDISSKNALEALFYFNDTHDIWGGRSINFPYGEKSHLNISEKILLKGNILEILTDYYRWKSFNKTNESTPISIELEKPEERTVGRPPYKPMVIEAYEYLLKKELLNFEISFSANVPLIQDAVMQLYPELTTTRGFGGEMIRQTVGNRFKADNPSN